VDGAVQAEGQGEVMSVTATTGLTIVVRFPFGRYAATPWFRSRREHVDNVEWPPSPWRIARALVAVAERHGDDERVARMVALVRRLATVLPEYALPPAGRLTYTQWMPALEFTDRADSGERSDNGHYLLDVGPDAELRIRWPGVELDNAERELLADVLATMPFLGQSVAVAEGRLGEDDEFGDPERRAVPADAGRIRLLAPKSDVTHADLAVDTADGILKSMPAPPGSRWVSYVLLEPEVHKRRPKLPPVTRVWLRLDGALRPPVRRLQDPPLHEDRVVTPDRLGKALAHHFQTRTLRALAVDEDGDGRAELVELTSGVADALEEWELEKIVGVREIDVDVIGEHGRPIASIVCRAWVEHVDRGRPREPEEREVDREPVMWSVDAGAPPLEMALPFAEAAHTAILSLAGRRFGAHAIPPVLSGRGADGRPLRERRQHAHKHVLVGSSDGVSITHLAVWAPGGFTAEERDIVTSIRLFHARRAVELCPCDSHPAFARSAVWRSMTPYLPFNFIKPRGRNSVEGQVRRELVEFRGFPDPVAVVAAPRTRDGFRLLRRGGGDPPPFPHDLRIEFAEPVTGPIALGRHAHFSLGVLVPGT
jgi:hypothetical protein